MFYTFVKTAVGLYLKLRYKIKVEGSENIPVDGPVILATNHVSDLDPPLIGTAVKRELSFFAKEELFKIPVLGFFIKRLNAFPVQRGKGDRAALKKSVEILQDDNMLLIFPEGTRSKDKVLGEFQEGASFIAAKAGAKIVPGAIIGSYNQKEGVKLIFGEPIDVSRVIAEGNTRKDVTKTLRSAIAQLLDVQ